MILRIVLIAVILSVFPQISLSHTNIFRPNHHHPSTFIDYDKDEVTDNIDCAPDDNKRSPLQPDPYGDGKNTNCDKVDGVDADGDGFAGNGGLDCNDHNKNIHPAATEQPGNNIDEDCDGLDI